MNTSIQPPTPSQTPLTESATERLGQYWETLRLWMTQAWRIAFLMARGAYLTQERNRLFSRLGEEVYYKLQKGELRNTELHNKVKDIDRITKKLEISEIRIRSLRFGQRFQPRNSQPSGLTSESGDFP